MTEDRLFVPLAREPFGWFRSGTKSWEVRRFGRQYTPKHVRVGRRVELRLGYQKTQYVIWGNITRVEQARSLSELFRIIPFNTVVPIAASEHEAIQTLTDIFRTSDIDLGRFIAFEIAVDTKHSY